MRSYNTAETCQLVCIFLLHKPFQKLDKTHIDLFRHDSLKTSADQNQKKS